MSVLRRFGLIWLFTFIVVLLGGCELIAPLHQQLHDMEEETNPWVGTWSLESVDGAPFSDLFADDEEIVSAYSHWTFDADGTWAVEFTIEYEYQNGGQFYGLISIEASGVYTLDGSNYVLIVEEDPDLFFENDNRNTGTWFSADDTLTLTAEDGSFAVFKRLTSVSMGRTQGSD